MQKFLASFSILLVGWGCASLQHETPSRDELFQRAPASVISAATREDARIESRLPEWMELRQKAANLYHIDLATPGADSVEASISFIRQFLTVAEKIGLQPPAETVDAHVIIFLNAATKYRKFSVVQEWDRNTLTPVINKINLPLPEQLHDSVKSLLIYLYDEYGYNFTYYHGMKAYSFRPKQEMEEFF